MEDTHVNQSHPQIPIQSIIPVQPNAHDPLLGIQSSSQSNYCKIFAYGSAECDQFYNEDQFYERKKPFEIVYFSLQNHIKVVKIACGSQHTLILSDEGQVFTFGNSDDGCLGREITNSSTIPGLVHLPIAVDLISAGDAHSVTANSVTGVLFVWGCVKSSLKGKLFKYDLPEEKKYYFFSKGIQDVKSGGNHIVILSHRHVYSWGENDTGALGTVFRGDLEDKKIFEPNAIGVKSVRRIFVGKNATFLETLKGKIYACGLNNYGQLGKKPETETERWLIPKRMNGIDGNHVLDIVGGEHHTLILTDDYKVLGAGRNDDGQLGEFEEGIEESEGNNEDKSEQDKELNNEVSNLMNEENGHGHQSNGFHPSETNGQAKRKTSFDDKKSVSSKWEENYESEFKPLKNLPKIDKIWTSSHFNYAREKDGLNFYGWGFGESYVLGNGRDDSVYVPWKINNEKFWANKLPTEIALGHSHIVFTNDRLGDLQKLRECVLQAKKRPSSKRPVSRTNKRMRDD